MDHTPVAGYTRYGTETSLSRLNRHRDSILVALVHQFLKGIHPFLPITSKSGISFSIGPKR